MLLTYSNEIGTDTIKDYFNHLDPDQIIIIGKPEQPLQSRKQLFYDVMNDFLETKRSQAPENGPYQIGKHHELSSIMFILGRLNNELTNITITEEILHNFLAFSQQKKFGKLTTLLFNKLPFLSSQKEYFDIPEEQIIKAMVKALYQDEPEYQKWIVEKVSDMEKNAIEKGEKRIIQIGFDRILAGIFE